MTAVSDPIRFRASGRCGWGKRSWLIRCGVCRLPVIFGSTSGLDLSYPSSPAGGAHWCGHRRCIRALLRAALVAADRAEELS